MLGVFSSFNFGLWNVEEVCPRGKLVKPGISCLYVGSGRSFHLVVPENFKMSNKVSNNINLEFNSNNCLLIRSNLNFSMNISMKYFLTLIV